MKLKYKILMAIIAVSIGLCLMIYQSYALWVVTLSGQENIVEVGCFNIEFIENTSSIALSNSYPVSDAKGMSGEAYSFTITNKCTVDSAYQVTLNTLNANTMGDDKVKYVIYKDSESKPSTGQLVNSAPINADKANITVTDLKESYIIASGELKGAEEENGTGESHTYNVYLWIDESAGNEVENTRFEASINIVNASTKIQPTAAETIEALAEANPDQLVYDETTDNNLRYIGAAPNNYVDFGERYPEGTIINKWEEIGMPVTSVEECNNMADTFEGNEEFLESFQISSIEEFKSTYCVQENKSNQPVLWRIIGVFKNIKDGTENEIYEGNIETRLKIIRDEPYSTGMAWDTDNVNDWSQASLQEELNTTYLNSIQSPYKEMIDNALWNLGGLDEDDYPTSTFYTAERGDTAYSTHEREWVGKIGLMYVSDYGYATSGGNTERDTCLSYNLSSWSSYSDCYNNDWLYKSGHYQWTLTPTSAYSSYVFNVRSSVNRSYASSTTYYAVSPALYLSSNVKIDGGDGSESNPFTLTVS